MRAEIRQRRRGPLSFPLQSRKPLQLQASAGACPSPMKCVARPRAMSSRLLQAPIRIWSPHPVRCQCQADPGKC